MVLPPPPNNDYILYQSDLDRDVRTLMTDIYTSSITLTEAYWAEADLDRRFLAGDQTVWNQLYGNLVPYQRRQFTFNHIRRIVNMICGRQKQNRKSIIVVPQENNDESGADDFTQVIMWAMNQINGLQTISEAFEGAVTTGLNLLAVWMDYRSDPIFGDIRLDSIPSSAFLMDPFTTKMDLSDCNYIWRRKWLGVREAISLYPDRADDIKSLSNRGGYDGRFQYMTEAYNYTRRNLMAVDELWQREYRTGTLLVDMQSGRTHEWRHGPSKLNEVISQVNALFPGRLRSVETQIPSVRCTMLINQEVMYQGPNPMGTDSYPFVPVMGYYDPYVNDYRYRIQGVVRGLRDSQYLYNRRKTIELDILESQVNSGWVFKENALVNPADVFTTGQGRGIAIKSEASIADVQRIEAPQIPPSMIELSRSLGEEMPRISGVNEELLGAADDDKAGVLSMLRQGAGLTTLQGLFDNLDFSQKMLGKLLIELIQANFGPSKMERILGRPPAPEFENSVFLKYDCVIEDGLNTSTQRQMQFAQLLQLRELGIPVPSEVLVENSTLQNKKELTQALQAQEQQQNQMQQMQMQLQIQEAQARINDLEAKVVANEGLGLERAARVQENRALAIERLAEAQKDRDLGALDQIKALKELESLDLSHLGQLVTLYNTLKEQTTPNDVADTLQVKQPNVEELAVAGQGASNG